MYMKYSSKAVLNWFHKTLGVDRQAGDEVLSTCPECGSDKFYFNIKKQIGICHKASCNFTPTLYDLIEIVGFPPGSDGVYDKEEEQEKELLPLILPGWPVAQMINGQLMTTNPVALEYLRGRGLSDVIIMNWRITCDGQRIYVPIYNNGELVNYNSRVLPGIDGRKYLYAKGRSTGKYILGWAECQDWQRLSLIENTFVSLSYRNDLHCSTTFGSNVSNIQADLIGGSKIRMVAVLWDEGAEKKADAAVNKLRDRGVKAAYWKINGQPDDYPKDKVINWGEKVFQAAKNGQRYVDLREECYGTTVCA